MREREGEGWARLSKRRRDEREMPAGGIRAAEG